MKKPITIAIIVAALGLGGYYYYAQQKAAEVAQMQAEAEAKAAEEAAAAAKAAEEVAAAAKAAEEAAAKAAEEAAAATTEAATEATADMSPADLMKPENFDAAKVTALIDASSAPDATKTALKDAVDAAAQDPALVNLTLEQVKSALGL